MPISVRLPDDSVRELPDGATGADLALSIGPRLLEAALAVRVDGKVRDLKAALPDQAKVAVVTGKDPAALEIIRHSTAHLLAQAVQRLFPGVRVGIGPVIEDGFYYDFDLPKPFAPEDLEHIEQRCKEIIEKNYSGVSPGDLRLDLPYNPVSIERGNPGVESLDKAKQLLFQALAVKETMADARLGLGCIYLSEAKFSEARAEFGKVLENGKKNKAALLGRGVAQYEEAVRSLDPIQHEELLKGALSDCNAALALDPASAEARYDKIVVLFESGAHKEALHEIDRYLSSDSKSSWADKLKVLKTKMEATQLSAVEEKVNRCAREKNREALFDLSKNVPYQMPAAIWSTMR